MNDPQIFANIFEGEESLDILAYITLLDQRYENKPAEFQKIFKYVVPSEDQKKNTNVAKLFIKIFLKNYRDFLKGNEEPNYLRKMRKLENILSGIPQRERGLRHLRWVFGEEEGKLN